MHEDKNKNGSKPEKRKLESDNLLTLCEDRIKNVSPWAKFDWWFCNWFDAFQLLITLSIPFILAFMLYVPSEYHRTINLFVLILSGFGTILQIFNLRFRFCERSKLSRETKTNLGLLCASYKDGSIDSKEFLKKAQEVLRKQDSVE